MYNLEHREGNFLALIRDVVFANAMNPYHQLFALAGCSFGDLEERVRQRCLDGTLGELRAAGAHPGHNEFKGKEPIVRGGREIGMASPEVFANPLVRDALETTSSGSRSRGTDLNDASGSAPASAGGRLLGVEGIQEIRLITNPFNAEYGGRPVVSSRQFRVPVQTTGMEACTISSATASWTRRTLLTRRRRRSPRRAATSSVAW